MIIQATMMMMDGFTLMYSKNNYGQTGVNFQPCDVDQSGDEHNSNGTNNRCDDDDDDDEDDAK